MCNRTLPSLLDVIIFNFLKKIEMNFRTGAEQFVKICSILMDDGNKQ